MPKLKGVHRVKIRSEGDKSGKRKCTALPVMTTPVMQAHQALVIIAEEVDGEALSACILNKLC
jgi:hypothetical protein